MSTTAGNPHPVAVHPQPSPDQRRVTGAREYGVTAIGKGLLTIIVRWR